MSRTITFTDHEIRLLTETLFDYCEIKSEGLDTIGQITYELDNGLGSILKKLNKDNPKYSIYKSHREGYKYPTYEEWLEKSGDKFQTVS